VLILSQVLSNLQSLDQALLAVHKKVTEAVRSPVQTMYKHEILEDQRVTM